MEDLVPLIAVTFMFGGGTLFLLSISPVGKAIAARILGRHSNLMDEEKVTKELQELRDEIDSIAAGGDPAALDALRRDMDQLAERVDFAERLLAKQRDSLRLGGGQ